MDYRKSPIVHVPMSLIIQMPELRVGGGRAAALGGAGGGAWGARRVGEDRVAEGGHCLKWSRGAWGGSRQAGDKWAGHSNPAPLGMLHMLLLCASVSSLLCESVSFVWGSGRLP